MNGLFDELKSVADFVDEAEPNCLTFVKDGKRVRMEFEGDVVRVSSDPYSSQLDVTVDYSLPLIALSIVLPLVYQYWDGVLRLC